MSVHFVAVPPTELRFAKCRGSAFGATELLIHPSRYEIRSYAVGVLAVSHTPPVFNAPHDQHCRLAREELFRASRGSYLSDSPCPWRILI